MLKKILKHPFLSSIIFLLIAIMIFLIFKLPPLNTEDNLDILARNNSADPVLRISCETDLSSISDVYDSDLNLYYSIPDISSTLIVSEFENLVSSLYKLLPTENIESDNELTLSILPSVAMSDDEYIALCQRFDSILKDNNLNNIAIIVFPKSPKKLSSITGSSDFTHIGVNINTPLDLSLAQELHDTFGDTRTLYIRDNILSSHLGSNNISAENLSIASIGNDINMLYYTVAATMPSYNTIFSPYDDLDNSLNITTPNSPAFCAIYSRIVCEPWLTSSGGNISNTSPYIPIETYDKLSGDVQLILSPKNTDLLSCSNILYKVNEVVLVPSSYKPYMVNFNTNDFPSGISRIKAVSQDANNPIVQSRDIVLQKDDYLFRADRMSFDYETTDSSKIGYIPILMYHTIADTVPEESQNSTVSTENFDAQMKTLISSGYHPISFKQLYDYIEEDASLPDKPFLITMDDGYLNNYTHAYPIYKKYNIPATLFVSPYYIKEENTDRHFGWAAAREMEASGLIDIQPHGYDHTPLPYLSLKDVSYHISIGLGLIEHNLGKRDVKVVSYPQFRNTILTRKTLEKLNIDLQITNLIKPYQKSLDINPDKLKRINVPNTMSPDELIATLDSYQ